MLHGPRTSPSREGFRSSGRTVKMDSSVGHVIYIFSSTLVLRCVIENIHFSRFSGYTEIHGCHWPSMGVGIVQY